jgi:hypothetical protein
MKTLTYTILLISEKNYVREVLLCPFHREDKQIALSFTNSNLQKYLIAIPFILSPMTNTPNSV